MNTKGVYVRAYVCTALCVSGLIISHVYTSKLLA